VTVSSEIERIGGLLDPGKDTLVGILVAEPTPDERRYVCAFEATDGGRSWLVVDTGGAPLTERARVRDAAWIAALCEVAGDAAFPGDLEELRGQLLQVRMTESPPGIEEAEAAALALERVLGAPPRVATPELLDAIGTASRRLETALDPTRPSLFSAAMQGAQPAVEELLREIEGAYRVPLDG
jgi:hypothetical protein